MRSKLYIFLAPFLLLTGIAAYVILRPMEPGNTGTVEIRKIRGQYRFYKNGKPLVIKGGSGYRHLKELAASGGNTLRTWDTAGLGAILDEAQSLNLNVMAGFYLPSPEQSPDFYKDSAQYGPLFRAYLALIDQYKSHPALLAWCLGNELPFTLAPSQASFYKAFRQLIDAVHATDKNHPVSTTLIEVKNITGIKLRLPYFDFISINTFGGIKTLRSKLKNISWLWNGPYLVTEWAPIGGWESETTAWQAPIENPSTKTAELFADYYGKYITPGNGRMLGSMAFYWGFKEEYTHTWFSVFTEDGQPTEIQETLSDCWQQKTTVHKAPKVSYLLMDRKGARENLLLTPGSTHQAELVFPAPSDSAGLNYHWEVLREDFAGYLRKWDVRPDPEQVSIESTRPHTIRFQAPEKEGAFRLFVTVSNREGYAATANFPFYVVAP
ncbi:MAG TPA: hypothetical protein VHK91_01045 [Flavisolibacter sp.]|nr:hypothetical protein [Flavisolibacter sp.]